MSDDATNNELENHDEATNETEEADKSKEKKHDCGAADLVLPFDL
jgi:hypothetical protein